MATAKKKQGTEISEALAQKIGAAPGSVLYLSYRQDMADGSIAAKCPDSVFVAKASVPSATVYADARGLPTIGGEAGWSQEACGLLWAVPADEVPALAEPGYAMEEVVVSFSIQPADRRRNPEQFKESAIAAVSDARPFGLGPADAEAFSAVRAASVEAGLPSPFIDRITRICQLSGVDVEPTTDAAQYAEYVCPRCFRRLGECSCSGGLPWGLVQIDRDIQKHIEILNRKGYQTRYCCAGHAVGEGAYIAFSVDAGIGKTIEPPEGFAVERGGGTIRQKCRKGMTRQEYEADKRERLDGLLRWCESLPVRNDDLR